jgi:hypothetical protein
MTRTRIALTTFAAFVVSQVMAVLIHGFVLAADYEPFDGTLLRSGADAWQFIFLPVAHLAFICGLMWLLWYAEQPWPAARREAAGTRVRVVGNDRIHDRLHRAPIHFCSISRRRTKMSPTEDASTGAVK